DDQQPVLASRPAQHLAAVRDGDPSQPAVHAGGDCGADVGGASLMAVRRALVLFAHGARDPRWAEPFRRLQEIVRSQSPELVVELAFLELMSPRLPELTAALAEQGVAEVTVVPVFLGQGGHVMRDLPGIVDESR